jgi:UDP-N-acetyl-D-mannosaminuronic acid dehydrogenase
MSKKILEKIENNTAQICVMGLGQVGLPVALSFCKAKFVVMGLDVNESHINLLKKQKSPFKEPVLQELLTKYINENKFFPTQDSNVISNSDIIIVSVPTPISEEIKPDLSFIKNACDTISKFELNDKLIIIESSIPPKTFEYLILPTLSKNKNKGNNNFLASYIPERLSPGQAFEEIHTTSRVVGALDEESRIVSKALYSKILKSKIFEANPIVAETCKLVENTFRDVNVAFANEIAMICEIYGIDVLELRNICNSHPRVNILSPGPGVGGPCLPKDPYLLLNPQNSLEIKSEMITNARKINDSMPFHVLKMIKNSLKDNSKEIKNAIITILGVTYKSNVSDTRYSPAEKIIVDLLENGCKVVVNDPKTEETFNGEIEKNIWKSVTKSDMILVLTEHDEFKNLDLNKVKNLMNKNPILIDTRRMFKKEIAEKLGFEYISIGYKAEN